MIQLKWVCPHFFTRRFSLHFWTNERTYHFPSDKSEAYRGKYRWIQLVFMRHDQKVRPIYQFILDFRNPE